jgi:hypothetical protein
MLDLPEKYMYWKKPLWQWITLYFVAGIVVSTGAYYVFQAKKPIYAGLGEIQQSATQYTYR